MIPIVLVTLLGVSYVNSNIYVDLSLLHPKQHNVFKNFYNVSELQTQIAITNINDDVGFFVIQAHSFLENVSLSNSSTYSLHSYVTGTNVGLIWSSDDVTASFYILRNMIIGKTIQILLVITVYSEFDPVPGGCNLSFDTIIAPYQLISYDSDMIGVKSQPPSSYGISCDDEDKIHLDMYQLYLPESDPSGESYFEGLEKMLTVKDVKFHGKKVSRAFGVHKYHRLFSSYRGTGRVFAVIATINNRSSAYVPAVSYGCDVLNWREDCMTRGTFMSIAFNIFLLFFGCYVTLFGHSYFRSTLFLTGFLCGLMIAYTAFSVNNTTNLNEKMIMSVVMGIIYGIVWVFLWWKYGIPLLSVQLTLTMAGVVLASVIFYAGLADFDIYSNDINFWVTCICIVLLYLIVCTGMIMHGHLISCCILGSFSWIIAFNSYRSGNLQYIVINMYRRLTVTEFNYAVIDPPFEFDDRFATVCWIIVCLCGILLQLRAQKRKPPFPPNRGGMLNYFQPEVATNERTPLIQPQTLRPPEYV